MQTTLKITAAADTLAGNGVFLVEGSVTTTTVSEAVAYAAQFPKWVGVRGSRCSGWPTQEEIDELGLTADEHGRVAEFGTVQFRACFGPDAVNKGKNETGLRRVRRLLSVVGPNGWVYRMSYTNSPTEEEFATFVKE